MYTAVIIITVLISVLLILVVLVQKSKGGGLASNFSGANAIMGVRRSNDFIEKATWTLAGIVAFLAITSAFIAPNTSNAKGPRTSVEEKVVSGVEYNTDAAALPVSAEEAPVEAPVEPAK